MKKYMTPVTEILNLEATSMICASKIDREGDISKDDPSNPYQNPDWHYTDPIENDEGELNSTAKGNSLWDDFEDE